MIERGTGSRLFAAIEKILVEGGLNAYDTAAFKCLARDGQSSLEAAGSGW